MTPKGGNPFSDEVMHNDMIRGKIRMTTLLWGSCGR